jgi:hypothetical protein
MVLLLYIQICVLLCGWGCDGGRTPKGTPWNFYLTEAPQLMEELVIYRYGHQVVAETRAQ